MIIKVEITNALFVTKHIWAIPRFTHTWRISTLKVQMDSLLLASILDEVEVAQKKIQIYSH